MSERESLLLLLVDYSIWEKVAKKMCVCKEPFFRSIKKRYKAILFELLFPVKVFIPSGTDKLFFA